jgi:hypothetical protein
MDNIQLYKIIFLSNLLLHVIKSWRKIFAIYFKRMKTMDKYDLISWFWTLQKLFQGWLATLNKGNRNDKLFVMSWKKLRLN